MIHMPRSARIDAPGVLQHVIGRGIEKRLIFRDDADREDFIARLANLATKEALDVYAWALMPNHFHLLCKSRLQALSTNMHRLLTGYVVHFNKRHRRHGHLFQNRFKSIVCQEDRYLKELVRYIHLNPLRAGQVNDIVELGACPYTGHSALTGKVDRPWQDTRSVLALFGRRRPDARRAYDEFIAAGAGSGRKAEWVGGGLVRSLGGWSEVRALRRRKARPACDLRILGDEDFVAATVARMEERLRQNLRLSGPKPDIGSVCRHISDAYDVSTGELCSGSRRRPVVTARIAVAWVAVRELGYSGADVARHLGVSTSCITRSVASAYPPDVGDLMTRIYGDSPVNFL
jgi:REP element-mobilizing transposase RayT